jgi:hypothetical protein
LPDHNVNKVDMTQGRFTVKIRLLYKFKLIQGVLKCEMTDGKQMECTVLKGGK